MSGLIKSAAAGFDARIRPLAFETPAHEAPNPDLAPLRERVEALEIALAEREAAAKELAEAAQLAFSEGEAAGRTAGRAEAEDRTAQALDRLQEAAAAAVAALDRRLEATDRLAALLAATCLDKLFGEGGARGDLVRDLIRRQLDLLREESSVEIRVSAEDFGSAEAAAAAAPGCAVTLSDQLGAGDCTIRLRLGTLEAGLGRQWGALRAALEGFADEGGEA